jgi:5-methylthioadenosine/S-adenosylhomocysteine deaminase
LSILIKDALLDGRVESAYIEENRIKEIGRKIEADTVIDGKNMALLPGLVNVHTHAAMTLFRSYADDMKLQDWLQTKIWPAEAKLKPGDIYWGTKLACLEMIKSGTTCFNDMYFHMDMAAKAVQEMGLRAVLSEGFIDKRDREASEEELKKAIAATDKITATRCTRIVPAWGPHAVYTVSQESLRALKQLSDETGYLLHMHLSETQKEVEECKAETGKSPAKYLEDLGFLSDRCVMAHGVWLDSTEIAALARTGAKVVHNPVSNMKLAVGKAMPYAELKRAGVPLSLGTDGAASNNSLDMFQTLKFASLLHKFASNDQTMAPAREIWDMGTVGGAKALRLDCGRVEEGALADLILVDLRRASMVPGHDLHSNLVYAASGECVDTLICDGRVLMRNRRVADEQEILDGASSAARDVARRASDG